MKRSTFLKKTAALSLLPIAMQLNEFHRLSEGLDHTDLMPVLFVGHGNPMNAVTDNPYRKSWMEWGRQLPRPKAILCISAHWLTRGTAVTMTAKPETIHDFGGFPNELYQQQYPAPGAVDYAKMTIEQVKSAAVHEDFEWGLDHGAWCVLQSMYPKADIPVYQLSLDATKGPAYHFQLAKELAFLRRKGVLIVASGNVVHNLRMMRWEGGTYDWAFSFDTRGRENIEKDTPTALVEYEKLGNLARMAHPSNDHYLPLLYALGLRQKGESYRFFNDNFDLGSVSMRSVAFGV